MNNPQYITSPDQIYVFTRTGKVVGHDVWSETHVTGQSTGGGGYLHNGSGHISSPSLRLSSQIKENQRIFIRKEDGIEFELQEQNLGFGVRENHTVSVIYAGDSVSKIGYPVVVINHSTNSEKIFHERASSLVKGADSFLGCLMVVFIPLLATLVAFIASIIFIVSMGESLDDSVVEWIKSDKSTVPILLSFPGLWLATLGVIIWRISKKNKKRKYLLSKIYESLRVEIEKIKGAYSSGL